jgi:hypothetical protein
LDYEDSFHEAGFFGEAGNDSNMKALSVPSPRAPPKLEVLKTTRKVMTGKRLTYH